MEFVKKTFWGDFGAAEVYCLLKTNLVLKIFISIQLYLYKEFFREINNIEVDIRELIIKNKICSNNDLFIRRFLLRLHTVSLLCFFWN